MALAKTSSPAIPTAERLARFTYAIRNIVAEAQRVEAAGKRVRYLNIGDPVAFGFATPPHLVEAVERAMRDGHNGYGPSVGLAGAREAVAAEYSTRGFPVIPDRVCMTAGTSEGIELALTAMVDVDGEVLVPMPTYPLYTAVLAPITMLAQFSNRPLALPLHQFSPKPLIQETWPLEKIYTLEYILLDLNDHRFPPSIATPELAASFSTNTNYKLIFNENKVFVFRRRESARLTP